MHVLQGSDSKPCELLVSLIKPCARAKAVTEAGRSDTSDYRHGGRDASRLGGVAISL